MELIQFKSINGRKFPNLKAVWAAINPADEEMTYQVEDLDPAQMDRFHLHVAFPPGPSLEYFKKKHGKSGEMIVKWWGGIDKKIAKDVSPRRLEYVLKAHKDGIPLSFLLPAKTNITALSKDLDKAGFYTQLEPLKKMPAADVIEAVKKDPSIRQLVLDELAVGEFPVEVLDTYTDEEVITAIGSARISKHVMTQANNEHPSYTAIAHRLAKFGQSPDPQTNSSINTFKKWLSDKEAAEKAKVQAEKAAANHKTQLAQAGPKKPLTDAAIVRTELKLIFDKKASPKEVLDMLNKHRESILSDPQIMVMVRRGALQAVNQSTIAQWMVASGASDHSLSFLTTAVKNIVNTSPYGDSIDYDDWGL